MVMLGKAYLEEGRNRSPSKAVALFKTVLEKAAERDDDQYSTEVSQSHEQLAWCYKLGKGVEASSGKALLQMRRSGESTSIPPAR